MTTANQTERGIACSCGSSELHVVRTTRERGYIVRRKECRVCGHRVTTIERRVGDPTPDLTATCSGLVANSIGQLERTLRLLADSAGGLDALPKNFGHAISDQPR
jgi:hypothetical protein